MKLNECTGGSIPQHYAEIHSHKALTREMKEFADNILSLIRCAAAYPQSGMAHIREDEAPEVRLISTGRMHGFLEWLVARCLSELSPSLQIPNFLSESERRLVLDKADKIGRDILGPSPTHSGDRVVVRLVLDWCSGAPCANQGCGPEASFKCPGPDVAARHPGEIGHFCIGGPVNHE